MRYISFLVLIFGSIHLPAQMPSGQDTLYGNEWIDFQKDYIKIKVAEEGIYKLTTSELISAGLTAEQIVGTQIHLYFRGTEIPIYVSSDQIFDQSDFILFYGQTNDDFLDRYLYQDPDSTMLNPGLSLVNDTAAYFLTLTNGNPLRYTIQSNITSGLPEAEKWYWAETIIRQFSNFIKRPNGVGSPSRFQSGDGFAGNPLSTQTINLESSHLYPDGPQSIVQFRIIANNSPNHELNILWNQQNIKTYTFNNFRYIHEKIPIINGDVTALNSFSYERIGALENRYALAQVSLKYPRAFHWPLSDLWTFSLNESGLKHIEIEGMDKDSIWFFNLDGQEIIKDLKLESKLSIGFQQSSIEQKFVLCSSDSFKTTLEIELLSFENPNMDDIRYLIIYHPELRIDSQGKDIVQQYVDYRTQSGLNATAISVTSLYDQFSYGVERHFIAIRNYLAFLRKNSPELEYVLLAGKGLDITHIRSSIQWEQHQSQFFIPTFGVPGSDNLLACGNHKLDQKFAIGRIPAVDADEISLYLEKVNAYEQLQKNTGNEAQRFWQKRIIHIHGGRNAIEQIQLGGILNRLKGVIENNSFAGNVFSFGKQSNEPVQGSAPEMIYHLINTGIGMITFLGHSGSTTLDFDIDNLSIYTNKDKYPTFIALGCSVGNMYSPIKSFGERFNLTPDKGTILFFSTSGLGYPATLETYARGIYTQIDNDQNQPSYGEIIRNVNAANAGTANKLLQETIEQHSLNGDPAIKPNYSSKPDYMFETSSLVLTPENIIVQEDSFQFAINFLNIGKNVNDSIDIRAILVQPDLERDTFFLKQFEAKSFRNFLNFQLPIPAKKLSGNYTLLLQLDPDSKLEEGPLPEAKTNNEFRDINGNIGFNFYIGDVNASPLYPPDFAVIHGNDLTFYGSSNDIFKENKRYVLEWDTSANFTSAQRYFVNLEANTSVFQQTVQLPFLNDTTTIFWRVNAMLEDSINPANWRSQSITKINTDLDRGFGMFHIDQFKKYNEQTLYVIDSGYWAHKKIDRQYLIRNSIFINSGYPSGFYDGQRINSFFPFVSVLEGIVAVVLSPETGLRWVNPPGGKYGSVNNSSAESISFPFPTKTIEGRQNFIRFLTDTIPEGATVLLYSILRTQASDYGAAEWAQDSISIGTSIFIELEKQGISQIRILEDGPSLPFITSFIKDKGMIDFSVALNPSDTILSTLVIEESLATGQYDWILSSMQQIDQLDWKVNEPEKLLSSNFEISLNQGQTALYQSNETSGSVGLNIENTEPIRLHLESHNDHRSAYQPVHWRLKGNMLPDLSWNMFNYSSASIDSIQKGVDIDLSMSIKNFSTTKSSTSSVHFILTNSLNEVYIDTLHLDQLDSFEVHSFSHKIESNKLSPGINQLLLVINPERTFTELRYDNNAIAKTFYVITDKNGPLMDVYFDGIRIMDGDLVSAKPEITIKLQDLNEVLRLQDSTLFVLKMKSPNSNEFEDITLSHPELSFIPASEVGKNEAQLIYKPFLMHDGQYFLEIQAKDASGNLVSSQPFRIRFQVINESSISALTNYPNPFSTKTKFVYTLTGVEAPQEYSIRIFSVSGQLVREINHYEIGPLNIGKHLTSYEWDGRDQYGNSLANGVYLYRLILKDTQNEPTKHLNTSLDQYSKGGWSKMVILR